MATKTTKSTKEVVKGEEAAKVDTGVETPEETGPIYCDGTAMTVGDINGFTPIDSSLTPEQRQARVLELLDQTGTAEGHIALIQGELLTEASSNGYWKTWELIDPDTGVKRPFSTWDEFVEQRLGLQRRTSYNRMEMYQTYVIKLKVPMDILKKIEWSKALLVTKIIDENNWPAVLDKIEGLSWAKVKEFAKNVKTTDTLDAALEATLAPKALPGPAADGTAPDTADASEGVKTLSIKMPVSQYDNVHSAIQMVKATTGTEKDSQALDVIASEYLAANSIASGKAATVQRIIETVEATYGVVLKVVSTPSDWDDAAE